MNLRDMLDKASEWSVRQFAKTGAIYPMWHVVDGNGEHKVRRAEMVDKDAEAVLMRAYFMLVGARRFLFIDEAWIGYARPGQREQLEQLRRYSALERMKDLPDRREAVMFAGEDVNGESVLAHRYILRPEHGKAKLAPLEFIHDGPTPPAEDSYGRFVNMLVRR